MENRVLRYFIEIVQEGNISHAAERLHISQPALSRQIMDLEDELGVTLFERGHRQITLTQEGHYLYERAVEITDLIDKTTYSLQSDQVLSGTLDIGSGESVALQPLMEIVADIIEKHPDIKVNLTSGDAQLVRQKLNNGTIDFGILMGNENLGNFHSLKLSQVNQWGVLMRSDHPLAKKTALTVDDLKGTPLMTSMQAQQQDAFRNWAGNQLDELNFIGHYNLIYNATLLVRSGSCIALAYADLINTTSNPELAFRPLTPQVVDSNNLVWNQNHPLSNVAQLFLKRVQASLKEQ